MNPPRSWSGSALPSKWRWRGRFKMWKLPRTSPPPELSSAREETDSRDGSSELQTAESQRSLLCRFRKQDVSPEYHTGYRTNITLPSHQHQNCIPPVSPQYCHGISRRVESESAWRVCVRGELGGRRSCEIVIAPVLSALFIFVPGMTHEFYPGCIIVRYHRPNSLTYLNLCSSTIIA